MQVAIVVGLLVLWGHAVTVFIPTSDVIDIAREIARQQGFSVSNRKLIYIDLLVAPQAKPPLPGFVSAGVFNDDHMVLEISINEKTGQVLDPTRCLLFQYPSILRFGAELRQKTKAQPLTQRQLSDICDCSLKTVRTPQRQHDVP